MDKKSTREIAYEAIRELAELNLELLKEARNLGVGNLNPEMLRILRDNAQEIIKLV